MEKKNPARMNSDLLSRLVKALTPGSPLAKLAALQPPRLRLAQNGRAHRRAGVTKNRGRGETKARRKMAKKSRKRNRR